MKYFAVALATLGLAQTSASNTGLRSQVQNLLKQGSGSETTCDEINSSEWWAERKGMVSYDQSATALDQICEQWNNNADYCNYKSMRPSGLPADVQNAACVMVGANIPKCIANPCNFYNTGDCTLQSTAGLCVWFTKEDIQKVNQVYAAQGIPLMPGHGCYRNPCNYPGYGKASKNSCGLAKNSVPGVFNCMWCAKMGGMGCQLKQWQDTSALQTGALCAPVGDKTVPQIYEQDGTKGENACQCSRYYSSCNNLLSQPGVASQFKCIRNCGA